MPISHDRRMRQFRDRMLRSSFARHSKPGSVLSPKIIMARSEMNGNGCNIFARNVGSKSKRWSDIRRIPLSVLLLVLPATLQLLRQPAVVSFHDSAQRLHAIPYNLVIKMTLIYIVLVLRFQFQVPASSQMFRFQSQTVTPVNMVRTQRLHVIL